MIVPSAETRVGQCLVSWKDKLVVASLHKHPGNTASVGRSRRRTLLKRQDWSGYHCMLALDLGHLS